MTIMGYTLDLNNYTMGVLGIFILILVILLIKFNWKHEHEN